MTRWERCLRLLWVLVFVPLLGGLGLELPRIQHDRHEAVERPTTAPLHASRRENSQASSAPVAKSSPVRRLGAPPLRLDTALPGPEGEMPRLAGRATATHWLGLPRRTWQARGPPSVVVLA